MGEVENLHSGHRKRVKDRFLRDGLDGFNDINAVEMLLFYGIPRRDTNETAHLLLKRFKSIKGIFAAEIGDLMRVEGVGQEAALYIHFIGEMFRRAELTPRNSGKLVESDEDALAIMFPYFRNRVTECVYLMMLDRRRRFIDCVEIERGDSVSVQFKIDKIINLVVNSSSEQVYLAHNHTTGERRASMADIRTTHRLERMLGSVGVSLLEHFIITEGQAVGIMADPQYPSSSEKNR